jgi:hypothetical protein
MVKRSGTRIFVPLAPEATLAPGDLVRTGRNSSVTLRFGDGSQVRLKENGRLLVPAVPGRTVVTSIQIDPGRDTGFPPIDGGKMRPRPDAGKHFPLDRRRPFPPFGGEPGEMGRPNPPPAPGGERLPPDAAAGGGSAAPGSVIVQRSGARSFAALTPESTLNPGDLVRTGSGSSVTLRFPDGPQVKLKENCSLLISPTAGRIAIADMRAPDRAP